MAVSVTGKVILDTNVFIDYLRLGAHSEWVHGRSGRLVRFLSSVVLMELRVGADTVRRRRAVDAIKIAFPPSRRIAPTAELYDRAGAVFRKLYGNAPDLADRLAPMNDVLIALTAWRAGATLVTGNVRELQRIARQLSGLRVTAP